MARKRVFVLLLITVCFVLVITGKLKAQEATPVNLIGHLQTLVIDEIDDSTGDLKCRLVHYLKAEDGRLYQIKDTKGILGKIKPSAKINISGSIVDSEMIVEAAELLSTEEDMLAAELTPETIGEQKTLVALFNYPDKPNQPFTIQDIQNKIINNTDSTDNFIRENSYDKTWINADFIDWQTLPNNSTYYTDRGLLLDDSIATLDAQVNFQNYARLIFIYVDSDAYQFCGWGTIGKWGLDSAGDGDFTASVSWIGERCAFSGLISHELGHNLGFWHASSVTCADGQYHIPEILWDPTRSCGSGTFSEYGDADDTMGTNGGHFSTIWKSQAQWIDSSQIQEAVNSEYTIDQVELPSGGTKILKIPLGKDIDGNDFYYWVEYRKNLGTFDKYAKDIVQIRAKPTSVYAGSEWRYNSLRFMKSNTWGDYVDIDTGKSFYDPYRGVKIELIEKTGSGSDSKARLKVIISQGMYSLFPTSQTFDSNGGSSSVGVTTSSDSYSWTAVSNATWITVTSGGSGTGNGTVAYSVSPNTGTSQRTGTMTIAGQTFTVTQAGDCTSTYSIAPTSQTFSASAGTGSVAVTAGSSCSWTAVSSATWITITSGSSGTGNGTVAYAVSANTGTSQRTDTMTIAGKTFTVTQAGDCSSTYGIAPTSQTFSVSAGTGSVAVTAGSSCSWTAVSNATWIAVTSGSSGTGNGTVTYAVTANTGASQRTGTMTIAGKTFTVTQAGVDCVYTIAPTSQTFSASAGTGSVAVTAGSSCSWTAVSTATWIAVTSGSSGTGNGTVAYAVTANTGASQRTGTMTIAGKTFTVTQAGDCSSTYGIAPTSQTFSVSAGTGSVTVTAGSSCSWTAVSTATWIAVTSGSSGTGNGTVAYSVAANTGTSQRTGTMTIAGQTFTVTQEGACAYTISHSNMSFSSSGGTDRVDVMATSSSCSWTAVSNATWITITAGNSGEGNGRVAYSVSATNAQAL